MPRSWTDEEKYSLIKFINHGMTFHHIANLLDRSETAIMSKFNEILNTIIIDGYYELTLIKERNAHDKPIYSKLCITNNKPFYIPSTSQDPMDVEEDFDEAGPSSQHGKKHKRKRTRVEV